MLASSVPTKIVLPFANNAGGSYINVVPVASQVGVTNGAASFFDGFPPNCFVALAAGGAGPFGKDFNGLLNVMSAWNRWACAGAPVTYDSTFQAAAQVGGYPSGAVVQSAVTVGLYWLSVVDNNATNPDTGGAGWVRYSPGPSAFQTVNLAGNSAGSAKTASFTADVLEVGTALTGASFSLTSVSLSFNGGTSGAGGWVDTGSFPTAADIRIYAFYNPTTNAETTGACLASTSGGQVYTGGSAPSGYTASTLIWSGVSVGGNLPAFQLFGRKVAITSTQVLANGPASTPTSFAFASTVPTNAKFFGGNINTGAGGGLYFLGGTPGNGSGGTGMLGYQQCPPSGFANFANVPLVTAQTAYYYSNISGGQFTIAIDSYEF